MKCITGKYNWLLAVSCWLLAVSCSSDGTNEQRKDNVLQVVPYTTAYQNNDAMSRRAVSPGYSLYTPDHDIAIGLYVLPETTPTVKLIRYSNGEWHSQATVEANENYTIYGYMPKKEPITSSISQSGGNVLLTLSGVPAVIADDVCFITGVKDMTGDLLQGKFDYEGKSDDNRVRLLMDHLFAAIRFSYSVADDYSALRTIKLKKMTLTTTIASVNATVTLSPNPGVDPVTSVDYVGAGTTSSATFFENTAGMDIKTEASTISNYTCCFAPILSSTQSSLTLVSIYDVYDRYGNKVRENCTATNPLPNLSIVRGQCVTLNLKVAPTYLGRLSDWDLDNPTFTVN